MSNQALECVTSEKLLGVVVDQNLTWKGHVDKVHRTVSMLLSKFWCMKPFLSTDARIKYYTAYMFPHLDYCSTVRIYPTTKTVQAAEKSSLNDFEPPHQSTHQTPSRKLDVCDGIGWIHTSHNGTQVLKWNSPRLYEGNVQICNRCQPETDQICR